MTRAYHERAARQARREMNRVALSLDPGDRRHYVYHQGRLDAHMETCRAIDRSAKRLQKKAKAR